jgi:hypothetical protein
LKVGLLKPLLSACSTLMLGAMQNGASCKRPLPCQQATVLMALQPVQKLIDASQRDATSSAMLHACVAAERSAKHRARLLVVPPEVLAAGVALVVEEDDGAYRLWHCVLPPLAHCVQQLEAHLHAAAGTCVHTSMDCAQFCQCINDVFCR